jgi:hypothetical protein
MSKSGLSAGAELEIFIWGGYLCWVDKMGRGRERKIRKSRKDKRSLKKI